MHICYSYTIQEAYPQLKYTNNKSSEWIFETVDTSPGYFCSGFSITTDSNNDVHIAYLFGKELRYANNTTGNWVITTIDNYDYKEGVSLAVDSYGYVHICYLTNHILKYCNNVTGEWNIVTIDSPGEDKYLSSNQ